jgi:hypothetical protein
MGDDDDKTEREDLGEREGIPIYSPRGGGGGEVLSFADVSTTACSAFSMDTSAVGATTACNAFALGPVDTPRTKFNWAENEAWKRAKVLMNVDDLKEEATLMSDVFKGSALPTARQTNIRKSTSTFDLD